MARRWRQENKDAFNEMVQDWRRRNPAKTRLQKYRRRMLEATASGEFTEQDIEILLERQDGLCVGCQADIIETFTIDHKIHLSRGGTNDPENIQLLCKSCKSSKGTKTNDEWIQPADRNHYTTTAV